MTNHVHLLIERKADKVGRIMHRLLTGYSQYYNRKCRKVGHLLQGRHKAILCESEVYMGQLVRYIHLNMTDLEGPRIVTPAVVRTGFSS